MMSKPSHCIFATRASVFLMMCAVLLMGIFLPGSGHAVTLSVVDQNGDPVAVGYRWLVEEDRTRHPNPAAVRPVPDPSALGTNFHVSYVPIVAQGTFPDPLPDLDPTKHYFISVLPDGGYTMGGASVKPGQASATVVVNGLPLPTAQISVFVFHDNQPINNVPDLPQEQGLAGFQVILTDAGGRFGMAGGQVLYDAFGNPIGTTYVPGVFDPDGNPVVDVLGAGGVTTNANGVVVIKNLPPVKYGVRIDPPSGQGWIQTSTIEGTKTIDAWVKANEPPYFTEFGPAGHHVEFGFVQEMNTIPAGGSATLSGQVVSTHMSRPPNYSFYGGVPFPDCYVGLNDMAVGTGVGIYAAACNGDSTFTISGVPAGNYQLVIWDNNLDVIFASLGVTVNDGGQCLQQDGTYGACDLGQVGVFDWFGHLQGTVFYDTNQNGFPDDGEVGLPNQAVNIRWRDGTMYQAVTTDNGGNYKFDEVFPFFSWLVAEVDFARFKATGATAVVDAGGEVLTHGGWTYPSYGRLTPQEQAAVNPNTGDNLSRTETGEVLTQAFQVFLGQTNVIHWGKANYGPGPDGQFGTADDENGGISGIVFYDTTRAEDDPRYNFGEPWQPGIPHVIVRLYRVDGRDANGKPNKLTLINRTRTDSWDANKPTDCPGDPLDPFYMGGKCYDGLRNFNQVRDGLFDGGYAFTSYWSPYYGAPGAVEIEGLPIGSYVVDVVPPANYKVVSSLDKNVDFGESYTPGTLALPPVCVGADVTLPADAVLNLFPDVAAPLAGQTFTECNRKEVVVQSGRNAPADFFLFTDVPPSAHVVGFILNDLANEFDPLNPNFGEKYAAPYVPISFKYYNGKEATRVYSDQYGNYNALVPSTFTTNIPNPSGMSPNMLIACMNDPGPIPDPDNLGVFITDPYYKTQYTTFCYTFQFMPAVTTYLDTPILPIAAFTGQNQAVLDCEFPTGTPIINSVTNPPYNGPYVQPGQMTLVVTSVGSREVPNPAGTPAMITRDYGFGNTPGTIKIGNTELTNVAWSAGSISGTVPDGAQSGQLTITRGDNGLSTVMGVTVTVGPLPGSATVRTVGLSADPLATPISDAITASNPGDLILVPMGTYNELVIMSKEVQLQGAGALSTVINAVKSPGEKVANWRNDITSLVTGGSVSLLPGQVLDFDPANNEPGLFNTTEAPGIMVLGQASGDQSTWTGNGRIDGFTVTGSDISGAIVVNGWTNGLQIGNNRLSGNAGIYGGGITVGQPFAVGEAVDGQNDNINIHHNHITQNGGLEGGSGGISLFTGADGYQITDNYICGNFTSGAGAGIGHHGLNDGGVIAQNRILFNESFNQLPARGSAAGGINIEGIVPAGGGLTVGTGAVTIDSNLIQGNLAGVGDGGGIRLAFVDGVDALTPFAINITNNMIVNNVSGLAGGGISLQDALNVTLDNNTVARNDSAATASEAFTGNPNLSTPQPAGIVSRAHSAALAAVPGVGGFSVPVFTDNIIWENRSFYWSVDGATGIGGLVPATPLFQDLGVLGAGVADTLSPDESNVLTGGTNPGFALPYFNGNSALGIIAEDTTPLGAAAALDEGGNFINVRFYPIWPFGNYSSPLAAGADLGALPGGGDTVIITRAAVNPSTGNLVVWATSSAQPDVVLTVQGVGNMRWDAANNRYVKSLPPPIPGSVTVTSSGGGGQTVPVPYPPADTVTITRAVVSPSGNLVVWATSSAQPDVYLTAEGLGRLTWDASNNRYYRSFRPPFPDSVTVYSNLGGSDNVEVPYP